MKNVANLEWIELVGDQHHATSVDTPLRKDAFAKSDEEKMQNIAFHFEKIMDELGLDLTKNQPHLKNGLM